MRKRVSTTRPFILLLFELDSYDHANDNKDDEDDEEADPTLSASRFCRGHSLLRVAETTEGNESRAPGN
jgi:hypothetical protein